MTDRPGSPILTFLFTDLENSTPLWEKAPEQMQSVAARHDELLRAAFEAHHGRVVKTTGDGFHVVFDSPAEALAGALAGQAALAAEDWPAETGPIRVRMGLHTGESRARAGDYYGAELNRAARVMGIGHGGQVLVSGVTAGLVRGRLPRESDLLDLGLHQLRGLEEPEQIFQLTHPDLETSFPPLESSVLTPNNLPTARTTFVGRERELAEIAELLEGTRLLTLLGPGGTGKTRLMLRTGAEVIDRFPAGVWLVELAPLANPEQVVEKVAAVLGVREQPGRPLQDALAGYLRRKKVLILLDNVEHLVDASAELAEFLLNQCRDLKILVTGRESLFIDGERTYQVPSLSLPDEAAGPEEIGSSEAVRLFVDRARAVRGDFELDAGSAAAVGKIVRQLDGIPLALELAAARLRVMSAEQIAERLNDRFRLLVGGRRTALPRQQTLQALIDWSWKLLDEEERVLLRRLSVFSGGWTIEDVQEIAAGESLDGFAVLDNLDALVHKSLVAIERRNGEGERFRLLESIRQYAQDRLVESGEGAAFRDRHAHHYASLVDAAESVETAGKTVAWLQRLIRETDNYRSALDWLEDRDPIAMVAVTGRLISLGGQGHWWFTPTQARRWLERALAVARSLTPPEDRRLECRKNLGIALGAMTMTGFALGRHDEALAAGREAVALLRPLGDTDRLSAALAATAFAAVFHGDWEEALAAGAEARELARTYGHFWSHGIALGALGAGSMMTGDFEAAGRHLEEVKALMEQLGGSWIGLQVQVMEGRYLTMLGQLEEAREVYEYSLAAYRDIGERSQFMITLSELSHLYRRLGRWEDALAGYHTTLDYFQDIGHVAAVANTLESMAYVAVALELPEKAASLIGKAEAIRKQSDNPITIPWEKADYEQALKNLGEMLGEEERDAVRASGRTLPVDESIALAKGIGD